MILSTGFPPSLTLILFAVPSAVAMLAYLVAALPDSTWSQRALTVAWVAHGTAMLTHLFGIGDPGSGARFGFAPALSAAAWLVVTVHAVETRFVPLAGARRGLATLGGVMVLLALVFPGEGAIHPASPWAPLHWIFGIVSYGLFGAAVLHGVLLDRAERAMRSAPRTAGLPAGGGVPLLRLESLTFRFVGAGFVVLTLAVLLGAWFASPWRWDHKTVFSILGWFVFAWLLVGRRVFGWRGRRATRWLYAGAGLLLLAYVGSRFVFEVLLHRLPAGGA